MTFGTDATGLTSRRSNLSLEKYLVKLEEVSLQGDHCRVRALVDSETRCTRASMQGANACAQRACTKVRQVIRRQQKAVAMNQKL